MSSVLVSHPMAAAVACATAAAFAQRDRLSAFFTGVAAAQGSTGARALEVWGARNGAVLNRLLRGVPSSRLRALLAVELLGRAAGRLATWSAPNRFTTFDLAFVLHDAVVASSPWPTSTNIVYAYEDSALRTLRRAARQGLGRVLDLTAPHWSTTERILREESERWPGALSGPPRIEPEWKKSRKDAELRLASVVSVASSFTRRSLEGAGIDKDILVNPYGFPVDQFLAKTAGPDGPFTVVAVGSHDLRKGTPYLLEAWRIAALPDARLRFVGPMNLGAGFLSRYSGLYEHVPYLPRSQIGAEYRRADLVAFPTLGDGFGLVIQEAMCSATPVLATDCSGAPACITDGVDGWVIPPRSIEHLVSILRWASSARDGLVSMGRKARDRAQRWTWNEAGAALVTSVDAAIRHN